MASVGYATLSIVPSVRGMAAELNKQLAGVGTSAGTQAGTQVGDGLTQAFGRALSRMTTQWRDSSRRMAATFTGATTPVGRGLANFAAGFRDADAAASGFTGRIGTLGGMARSALNPSIGAVALVAQGFRDAQVASSAFSGRLGSLGGVLRTAVQPGITAAQNLAAGFSDSQAAASAFTGRLGTLGGVSRSALQPAITGALNLRAGFQSSQAAASAFTGRLGSLGGTARIAFDGVSSTIARMGPSARSAFSAVSGAASSASGAVRSAFTSASAGATSGVSALSGAFGRLGAVGAAAVGAIGLGSLGSSAVSAAMDIQQTSASMAGLYGSTKSADDMMRRLREYSRNTPLETQSLYDAGKNLAYLGLEGDSAMKVVQNVGTALMASGNTSASAMTNVTGALLSMQSAGQLYAGDIQKVSDQMVPAWDMLAAHMGMSIKEVRKEVTEGNLTVDDFVAAMQAGDGDYFQMMRQSAGKTSQTFKAQFSQVKDNILTTLGETLLPLVDRAAPALGRLGAAIDTGLKAVPGILAQVRSGFEATGIGPAVMGIVTGLRQLGAAAAPAVQPLVAAFSVGLGAAIGVVRGALSGLGSVFQSVSGWMREHQGVVQALGAMIGGAAGAFVLLQTVMAVARGVTLAFAAAQAVLAAVMNANPISLIVIAIGALVAGLIYAYHHFEGFRTVVDTVAGAVKTAALWIWDNGLKPAFDALMVGVDFVRKHLWLLFGAGPIGAIIYFAVTIYRHFDTIKSALVTAGQAVASFWSAYVSPAFSAIGTAAMWLWSTVLSPVFSFIGAAVRLLAVIITTIFVAPAVIAFNLLSAAAMWLWTNAIGPAFRAIGALAMWLWTNALLPAWNGIKAGLSALGTAFRWLYTNVVKPVFGWIKLAALVWWTGVKVIFAAVRTYVIGPLGSVFRWLYNSVVKPVFTWIRTMVANWWRGVKIIFAAVRTYIIGPLGSVFRWLWNTVIRPVWNGIKATISGVWNGGIKPIFNALRAGVRAMWKAFQTGKKHISTAWKGIRDSAKKPVNFLIDTVYNNGIRSVWNKVAGIVGAKKLGKAAGFARGGILPGTSSYRQGDSLMVPMRPGEGVYMSEVMKDPYERARLAMMNGAALKGTPPAKVRNRLGQELGEGAGHFAKGGVVGAGSHSRTTMSGSGFARGGWLGVNDISPSKDGIVGKVGKFLKDVAVATFTGDFGGAVDAVFKPMKTATGMFGKEGLPGTPYMAVGKMHKLVKTYLVDKWDSFMASFGGGGGEWIGLASASERLRRAAKWAQTQHGKPYQWGGGGNPSWDCSGFMAGIENVIRGIRPGRRYTTHSFGGSPPSGWQRNLKSPFTVGVQHGGRGGGHMAGTLLGKNVESGGRGVQVGSGARGTNTFPNRFGFKPVVGDMGKKKSSAGKSATHGNASTFDNGGLLKPGLQLVHNGTGRPETIRTAAQEERVERLVAALERGGFGGNVINVQPPPTTVGELVDGVSYALRKQRRGGVYASAS